MTFARPDAALGRFACFGCFDATHAHAAGLTEHQIRHRVSTGVWEAILPRVYRHATTPVTPLLLRQAALLWAGDAAALSHRSAAVVHELDGSDELRPEILTPAGQRLRSPFVIVHRSAVLPPADVITVQGLRCTSVVRTLIDLAAVVHEQQLEMAVESARRRYGTELQAVRSRLEEIGGTGRAGTARLRTVLDELEGRTAAESLLEVRVARRLRASTLPQPVRQHWVHAFGRRYRLDFAWPDARVALECDGRRYHEFQRDRTRLRQLGAIEWHVLPVTWQDERQRWPQIVRELDRLLHAKDLKRVQSADFVL